MEIKKKILVQVDDIGKIPIFNEYQIYIVF